MCVVDGQLCYLIRVEIEMVSKQSFEYETREFKAGQTLLNITAHTYIPAAAAFACDQMYGRSLCAHQETQTCCQFLTCAAAVGQVKALLAVHSDPAPLLWHLSYLHLHWHWYYY